MSNQIKVVSFINRFQLEAINWSSAYGQFIPPRVNWFYLLDEDKERIQCFDADSASLVIKFLDSVIHQHQGFGNITNCFINIQTEQCNNDSCEDEVADGIRQNINGNLPYKIFPNDFGINGISAYTLSFNIIGYIF
jgi:hypothetical protein